MKGKRLKGALLLWLGLAAPVLAGETIRLATLAYPPFCDAAEDDGGALVAITRAAFAQRGIAIKLSVLPWPRLVSQLEQGRFDGVIGVWSTDLAAMRLRAGTPVFHSLIGVYLRHHANFSLPDVGALKGRSAGIVHGYNYSATILQAGMRFETARDDETNLRKLQLGRVDVAIVEKAVGDALLATPRLQNGPPLRWGGLTLAHEPLTVGFAEGRQQHYWHAQFQAGFSQLKQSGQYMRMVQAAGLQEYLPPVAGSVKPAQ